MIALFNKEANWFRNVSQVGAHFYFCPSQIRQNLNLMVMQMEIEALATENIVLPGSSYSKYKLFSSTDACLCQPHERQTNIDNRGWFDTPGCLCSAPIVSGEKLEYMLLYFSQ